MRKGTKEKLWSWKVQYLKLKKKNYQNFSTADLEEAPASPTKKYTKHEARRTEIFCEYQEEKGRKKNEQSLRHNWNSNTYTNIHLIGAPEKKERRNKK